MYVQVWEMEHDGCGGLGGVIPALMAVRRTVHIVEEEAVAHREDGEGFDDGGSSRHLV